MLHLQAVFVFGNGIGNGIFFAYFKQPLEGLAKTIQGLGIVFGIRNICLFHCCLYRHALQTSAIRGDYAPLLIKKYENSKEYL